jgi:hypothetical protein
MRWTGQDKEEFLKVINGKARKKGTTRKPKTNVGG